MTRAAVLALASVLPLTSGCVAAAIPLAAGAAIIRGRPAEGGPPAASTVTRQPLDVLEASAEPTNAVRLVPTGLTSLPTPDGTGARAPVISAFETYALAQASIAPASGKRPSALLQSASELRVVRQECGVLPAAVFIDLDPGRETFDPLASGSGDEELATSLANLREKGVKIVWFSRLGENFAIPVRKALAQSGLDRDGGDRLVLMSAISERKQSLRDDVAREVCPIAILGDERADFDELYLYLKNPDAAVALDGMIGRGWFLTSPFTPVQKSIAGAKP